MVRLESDRLIFRDHELQDLEEFVAIESDPVYRGRQPVRPREELERRFKESVIVPRDFGIYATIRKSDQRYLGRCGLYPFRNTHDEIIPGEAFIAFYIGRPYWGHGYATEAGRAWIRYGFDVMQLKRIEAGVAADNKASLRVIEKLGFQWLRSGGDAVKWHDFELRNV